MNLNIFPDLRKPGLVPGKSLSPRTKFESVLEKKKFYRVKFNPTAGRCLKGYTQIKGKGRSCIGIDFGNMTKQLQIGCVDMCESVQPQIHQVSKFDESSAVSTTYLGKGNMSRGDAFRVQEQFSLLV